MDDQLVRSPNVGIGSPVLVPGVGSSSVSLFPQNEVRLPPGTILTPIPGNPNVYTILTSANPTSLEPGSIVINNYVGQETVTSTRQEGGGATAEQITQQRTQTIQESETQQSTQTIQENEQNPEIGKNHDAFSFGNVLGCFVFFGVGVLAGILGMRVSQVKHAKRVTSQAEHPRRDGERIRRLQIGPMATFEF